MISLFRLTIEQQELRDDDYLSFESENEIDTTSAWDNNKTSVSKPSPIYKLSTDYNKKLELQKKKKKKKILKKELVVKNNQIKRPLNG